MNIIKVVEDVKPVSEVRHLVRGLAMGAVAFATGSNLVFIGAAGVGIWLAVRAYRGRVID